MGYYPGAGIVEVFDLTGRSPSPRRDQLRWSRCITKKNQIRQLTNRAAGFHFWPFSALHRSWSRGAGAVHKAVTHHTVKSERNGLSKLTISPARLHIYEYAMRDNPCVGLF